MAGAVVTIGNDGKPEIMAASCGPRTCPRRKAGRARQGAPQGKARTPGKTSSRPSPLRLWKASRPQVERHSPPRLQSARILRLPPWCMPSLPAFSSTFARRTVACRLRRFRNRRTVSKARRHLSEWTRCARNGASKSRPIRGRALDMVPRAEAGNASGASRLLRRRDCGRRAGQRRQAGGQTLAACQGSGIGAQSRHERMVHAGRRELLQPREQAANSRRAEGNPQPAASASLGEAEKANWPRLRSVSLPGKDGCRTCCAPQPNAAALGTNAARDAGGVCFLRRRGFLPLKVKESHFHCLPFGLQPARDVPRCRTGGRLLFSGLCLRNPLSPPPIRDHRRRTPGGGKFSSARPCAGSSGPLKHLWRDVRFRYRFSPHMRTGDVDPPWMFLRLVFQMWPGFPFFAQTLRAASI